MSDRRRLLMQLREEASILPEGYYPCEYIESDGQQYIDTQVYWHTSGRLVMDVEPMGAGTLFGTSYYGSGEDEEEDYEERYMLDISLNGYIVCESIDSNKTWNYNQIGVRSVIDWNERDVYLNGEKIMTLSQSYNTELRPAGLFGHLAYSDEQWGESIWYISAKLYSCQMYNSSGELLRDYVPCFSAAYGKFGLYDRVSKTFFGSETTIDFKGKLIVPEGYSGVEYIYGDGNAFIDTGFIANQNTRAIIDYEYPKKPTALTMAFGASYNGQVNKAFAAYLTVGFNLAVDYGQQTGDIIGGVVGSRIVFDVNQNIASVTHSGVKTTRSFTKIDFTCDNTLLILELNGVSAPLNIHTVAKVYFSAIWDNGTLVRLFAPCVNPSNVYGLYDLVNKQFYQSAGSSQFGEEPTVYDFDYTGGEQSILLKAGNYKLETWGASGGASATENGGNGGYSVGVYSIQQKETLFINVGGRGQTYASPSKGGYNGGGDSGSTAYYDGKIKAGAGGGATHIATKSGLLESLINYKDTIIIVAGGGGGGGGFGITEDGYAFTQLAGKGGIGGGIGGGAGGDGSMNSEYSVICGDGGAAGSPNLAGAGGTGGRYYYADENDGHYISGAGGGGGGGLYAGGGGGGGSIADVDGSYTGRSGSNGMFGKGGKGGDVSLGYGYYAGAGAGGGGGSGYLAPSLTSASSNAGQRSGHGYARITKI